MRPLLLFFLALLGGSQAAQSQTHQLTGTVKDELGETIPFASVFLLQASDSTMVKGTSADETGIFLISDITPGLYIVQCSYIGKSSEGLPLDIRSDIKIGALIIPQQAEQLDEVVVVSARPRVERKVDRLVFNVENTVLSQSNSWDILKQTPGVILMQDELQIRNQPAVVYINDRKVQLSPSEVRSLLENYQGQHIKSVEVINNPPARYDAEGGAVLNIITNKNISLGYKGNFSSNYTQGIFPKYNFGTSHFYKTNKLNINASYAYAPRKDFKDVQNRTNFINDTGVFSRWDTDFDKTNRFETHIGGLTLDYTIDDRNEINLTSNMQLSPKREYDNFQSTVITNGIGILDSTFTTASFLDETKNNISGDVTYKHTFKENGSLQVNAHYTTFDLSRTQRASSDYFLPTGDFIRNYSFFTDADQDIEIITAQLDYSTLLGTVSFETGAKLSMINSESRLQFFTENNGRVFVPNLSDNFLYDENVYAAYVSASKDWEKWSLKAGLRAEHTQSSGNSLALSTVNELEYFELFPSVYMLHTINENHSVALDYSRKLQRPRYEDLNPFRTFINENIFYEGNPTLVPNFSNNFNLNYTLNQEFFFDLYYRDNGNYISTLSFQDNENQVLRDITQNVLESTSYGLDFNYGKSITNNWYVYSYLSIFHEDETFLALESDAFSATNEINGYYIDVTNYLTLSKDGTFKGELGLAYLSGFLAGSYTMSETTNLTMGLQKSLWNRRAELSLNFNDILGKANPWFSSKYLNQDNSYIAVEETQNVRLSFIYNFGNFRLEDNQRQIEKAERDRIGSE
ncbi:MULTISPECIES: outer membrane beta-barrel family protein [Maribacter]|uniref:Outer membrane beta-barrel family protein n=1 Tax=Maribacter flavus TaxID=1658664 RepID=A0ABU7IEY5_9FLAO|nr:MULTISPECIES: outer membrane beta-barrel family protein [Maribacter]MDC6404255.1 outer membrane beta-barrel family protein [Maribacter sp. PR66]MEE1971398.1 outer membrane beta-barrel family protein [Maribacter flavus]